MSAGELHRPLWPAAAPLAKADLIQRWCYSRQGVEKLIARRDFPSPLYLVAAGRVRLWCPDAIERYERSHPEVLSEGLKRRKMIGNYLAIISGEDGYRRREERREHRAEVRKAALAVPIEARNAAREAAIQENIWRRLRSK